MKREDDDEIDRQPGQIAQGDRAWSAEEAADAIEVVDRPGGMAPRQLQRLAEAGATQDLVQPVAETDEHSS